MKKTKWSVRLFALLSVLALVAAACGDGGGTSTTAGGGEEPGTTTAETPDTTAAGGDGTTVPEGELGSVTVAAGDMIQIRSLNAISGETATLGIPNQVAVEIAIEDYGPIKGHDVTIGTGLDDLCNAEGGQAAAQTIAADEQVVGVIGTSCSGAAVAASPVISDAGLVMISPSNTSPALTSDLQGNPGTDYHPGYFRTAHNDLFQGQAVANFVYNELGLTTAAAIHDGDPYTQGLAGAFQAAFEELGGTITTFTGVNKGDTDMTPVLSEVAAGAPEAIYFPIFPPEGDFIVQQIGGVAGLEDVTLLAADGLLVANFLGLPETAGMYFSGPSLQFGDNVNEITGLSATDFLTAYEEREGEPPTAAFWAHAYDAATMLLAAIDSVAVENADGSLTIDRQALRDAVAASDFDGMIGHLTCDEFGDCGSQEIQIVVHPDPSITDSTQLEVVYTYSGLEGGS
ncbi:MAG TPA: branched-chain amino acid ABC transporter substrate-binding protein [Acidimicrobiia bacterium]|jgi:branched-chain amino acid transport system substrate-binding protein|nr:branched-chain amino acid ABC transporter substrate-binding protein [Acidimicrobiia bacterium]